MKERVVCVSGKESQEITTEKNGLSFKKHFIFFKLSFVTRLIYKHATQRRDSGRRD